MEIDCQNLGDGGMLVDRDNRILTRKKKSGKIRNILPCDFRLLHTLGSLVFADALLLPFPLQREPLIMSVRFSPGFAMMDSDEEFRIIGKLIPLHYVPVIVGTLNARRRTDGLFYRAWSLQR